MILNNKIFPVSHGLQSKFVVRLIVVVFLFSAKCNTSYAQIINQEPSGIGYFKMHDAKPDTIIYKISDGKKLRLLVVRPSQSGDQKVPAMVWIHGGAWVAGSPEGFVPHLQWSAANGAVGISVEYRLIPKPENSNVNSGNNTIEDCLADCADAIIYIRQHAVELGIDARKIIVIGDSAGGHLALCLGTMDLPEDAKANVVINCNGISDMTPEKWIKYISSGEDQLSRAKKISPVNFLDSKDAPILTMNGDKDQVVTPSEAESFWEYQA